MPLNTLCNYFYILLIMKILFKEMKHLHFSHTWLPPNVYMNVISIQFCQHFWFSQHFKCREGRVPLQYVSICCATVTISTVIREDSLLVFSVLSPERHTLYRSGSQIPTISQDMSTELPEKAESLSALREHECAGFLYIFSEYITV